MSVKLVFNNGTNAAMGVYIHPSDVPIASGQSSLWRNVSGHRSASGTVSGHVGYVAQANLAASGRFLTTKKFSGDTEVTFAVFTMPLSSGS